MYNKNSYLMAKVWYVTHIVRSSWHYKSMSWDFVMASKAMQQMQLCDNLMVIQTLPLYNISAQQTIDIAQQ